MTPILQIVASGIELLAAEQYFSAARFFSTTPKSDPTTGQVFLGQLNKFGGFGYPVSRGFWEMVVVPAAAPIESPVSQSVNCYELQHDDYDRKIRKELLPDHVFGDAGALCSNLAALLLKQDEGKDGLLLNDGSNNLFYVVGVQQRIVVIGIRCRRGKEWYVGAWPRGANLWRQGSRIFEPVHTVAQPAHI